MLKKWSIRSKLLGLVFAAAVACCCVAGAVLWVSYQRMYDDRVAKLRALVEVGVSLAARFETEAVDGRITREEAQAGFKDALRAVRYSGQEYIFADTYDCVVFAHPNPKLMGKNISDMKDANGQAFMPILAEIARSRGEGTHAYTWPLRPDDPATAWKLSYVKDFAPWGIFIGTGFIGTGVFTDDVRSDFVNMFWKVLGVVLLLALPAISLIAVVGASVSGRIRNVSSRMQALADGDLAIELPEADDGDEVGQMAHRGRVSRPARRIPADATGAGGCQGSGG